METSVDPRIRPSLTDLASRAAARDGEAGPAGPGDGPAEGAKRKAFAHYRSNGTDEVTTLGPDREVRTAEAPLRFGDLVDLVNPLQHIPVVSSLYRTVTGDEIAPAARIFGSMIYTGALGFVYATVDSLFAEISGRPFGDTLVSAVFGGSEEDQSDLSDLAKSRDPAAAPEPAEQPAPEKQIPRPARPDTSGETLTGENALRALADDLRIFAGAAASGGRETAAAPAAQSGSGAPATAGTPEAALRTAARPGPALAGGDPPQLSAAFARKMTEALDKYRTMAEARRLEEERRPEGPQAPAEIP